MKNKSIPMACSYDDMILFVERSADESSKEKRMLQLTDKEDE